MLSLRVLAGASFIFLYNKEGPPSRKSHSRTNIVGQSATFGIYSCKWLCFFYLHKGELAWHIPEGSFTGVLSIRWLGQALSNEAIISKGHKLLGTAIMMVLWFQNSRVDPFYSVAGWTRQKKKKKKGYELHHFQRPPELRVFMGWG